MTVEDHHFKEQVFDFLDDLRESGLTNMFGARPYVMKAFKIKSHEAGSLVQEWIRTFSQRHPKVQS